MSSSLSEDSLPVLKVLVIGPSGAGKSALLLRYCDDHFDQESTTATIGIDFKMKRLIVRGKAYRLNIFDTAGQERFRTLSTSYYRGAHAIILVYDISNRKSFLGLDKWVEEIRSNASPEAILYVVGSKLDKASVADGRAVSVQEATAFSQAHDAVGFCEVSAKTRDNVKQPFVEVVDQIIQRPQLVSSASEGKRLALDKGLVDSESCSC